jgi:uncharacterized protein
MSEPESISIEVVYALPTQQKLIRLQVPAGTTALQAVILSRISEQFPGLEVQSADIGIFGQALGLKGGPGPAEYRVKSGDRVEIYRPLISDPKDVRRRLAERQKNAKQ